MRDIADGSFESRARFSERQHANAIDLVFERVARMTELPAVAADARRQLIERLFKLPNAIAGLLQHRECLPRQRGDDIGTFAKLCRLRVTRPLHRSLALAEQLPQRLLDRAPTGGPFGCHLAEFGDIVELRFNSASRDEQFAALCEQCVELLGRDPDTRSRCEFRFVADASSIRCRCDCGVR